MPAPPRCPRWLLDAQRATPPAGSTAARRAKPAARAPCPCLRRGGASLSRRRIALPISRLRSRARHLPRLAPELETPPSPSRASPSNTAHQPLLELIRRLCMRPHGRYSPCDSRPACWARAQAATMHSDLAHAATPSAAASLALTALRPRETRCLPAAVLLGTRSHQHVRLAPASAWAAAARLGA